MDESKATWLNECWRWVPRCDALSDMLPDKAKGKRKEQLALVDIAHDEEGEEEEKKISKSLEKNDLFAAAKPPSTFKNHVFRCSPVRHARNCGASDLLFQFHFFKKQTGNTNLEYHDTITFEKHTAKIMQKTT